MLLLPFEKITYRSRLSEEEIIDRLHDLVETEDFFAYSWSLKTPDHRYQGQIDGSEFKFHRIIFYRNSFLPVIVGNVEQGPDGGTIIHVKMRLHYLVMVFLAYLIQFWSIFFIYSLREFYDSQNSTWESNPILILLAIYAVILLGFKIEANKDKEVLCELFESE